MPIRLTIVFVTVLVHLIGFGIVIPVLPLYAERFGASAFAIGCLVAIYSFMQLLFAPVLGRLSDRIGRKPVLLLSMIGTALAFFLMGAASTLTLLFVARALDGITGGSVSAAQAYIADITPEEERSRRLGLIGAAFGLGFIFGPAIGGVLSRLSLQAPFFFASALSLVNAWAVWIFLPESLRFPHPRSRTEAASLGFASLGSRSPGSAPLRPTPLGTLWRIPEDRILRLTIATYFLATLAFSLLTATYPLFAEHRFGYGATECGFIFACLGMLAALIQGGLLGILLRRVSDRFLIVLGAATLSVSFFFLPIGLGVLALFSATAGVAVGHSLMAAPLNGLASKSTSPATQGEVLGLMQSAASLARIVGPVAGGWLLHLQMAKDPSFLGTAPYWFGAGVMAICFFIARAL